MAAPVQRSPSEIHNDWEKAVEAIRLVSENASKGNISSLPNWTENLSISEIREITEATYKETGLQYSLGMFCSIEGMFINQLKLFVSRKRKDNLAKVLRRKFKEAIEENREIRFDDILDTWKKNDPRVERLISSLKSFLQYRHWLAHGRSRTIHYWNCPDPNTLFLLYIALDKAIGFDPIY